MRSARLLSVALGLAVLFSLGIALLVRPPVRRSALGQDLELQTGNLLVADRKLSDPNFAHSVILLVKYEDEGSMGLMINKRTDVPISQALGEWKEAKGRREPVFVGGPVEKASILGLIDSGDKTEQALEVVAGVRMAADGTVLRKELASGSKGRMRIYLGYAGWGPEQLEAEIGAGAWHILHGDRKLIFDSDPDTLWTRMIEKTETRFARAAYSR